MRCPACLAVAKFRVVTCTSSIIGLAAAVDLLVWRAVFVHPIFHRLPAPIRTAILAHEEGHLMLGHTRQRLRWLFSGRWWRDPEGVRAALKNQEYEADAYCASRGFADFLIAFLLKSQDHATKVRPSSQDRIARLRVHHEFGRRIPTGGQNTRH